MALKYLNPKIWHMISSPSLDFAVAIPIWV
jgi:hypothetical protein